MRRTFGVVISMHTGTLRTADLATAGLGSGCQRLLTSLDAFENVGFGEARRRPLLVRGLIRQPLEAFVCWRRDAGQSTQQHDLTVQVVGFNGTR